MDIGAHSMFQLDPRAPARHDAMRRRWIFIARALVRALDSGAVPVYVDELRAALRRAPAPVGPVGEDTAREDVRDVAKAIGWRVVRLDKRDGLVPPGFTFVEDEPTKVVRTFLRRAFNAHGANFRVQHGVLGRELAEQTGRGNHDLDRIVDRGARRGEWAGNRLQGWVYNPNYKPPGGAAGGA